MALPNDVREVLARLHMNGHEAYVVGGGVRDMIMNRASFDFDITTSALPQEIDRIFKDMHNHRLKAGRKFGTIAVVSGSYPIEITTYRKEIGYTDRRHPDNIFYARTLDEDISRRDFTINTICCDIDSRIVDKLGGVRDLRLKTIRAVGEPADRFHDDALRILRAYRFVSSLGFKLERKTEKAMRDTAEGLNHIAGARILAELSRILIGANAAEALGRMKKDGIFEQIAPSLRISSNWFNSFDEIVNDVVIRFIVLFWETPVMEAAKVLERLNCTRAMINTVSDILENRDILETDFNAVDVKRLMAKISEQNVLMLGEVAYAYTKLTKCDDTAAKRFCEIARKIIELGECYSRAQLAINGSDLLLLGINGKRQRKCFELLLESAIISNGINNHEKLLTIAKKWNEENP